MKSHRSLGVVLMLGTVVAAARGQLDYTLTNLTTGSDYSATAPYGISSTGHITGYGVEKKTGEIHAFIFSGGTFQDLGLLGYGATVGIGINSSDQVALDGETPGEDALIYANGQASQIGNIDGNSSWCYGINNLGDIVGGARADDGGMVAFSWVGGTFNDLSALNAIYARSINDSDVLVGSSGYYWTYGGYIHSSMHAYVYDGTTFTDLGSLTGDPHTNTEAYGINNSGQIVGYSFGSDGFNHAFLYQSGAMQDLGTINGGNTTGVAINNSGLIVGNVVNNYGAILGAFVDWNGTMWDFGSLIKSGGSGWSDFVITGVNDSGTIVGWGTVNNGTQGFMATLPVASWKNYGAGFAGTNGIPGLTAEENPVLGTTVTIDLGNSLGAPTAAIALVGFSQTSIVTGKGGTILVAPTLLIPMSLPGGGTTLAGTLPADPSLSGVQVDLQVIEADAGAAKGLSFTAGLELDLGY